MARSTLSDEVLAGYRIPVRSWVEVSAWGVHHSPAVWPDSDRFDPRRFDDHPASSPVRVVPVRQRTRACIGMQIATLEAQLVTGTIVQAFTVTTPLPALPVHAAITLLPTGALPIQLHHR